MKQLGVDILHLFRSLWCACRGIFLCAQQERNFRVHLCATIYVLAFAEQTGLELAKVAVVLLAIAIVLAAELINSSVERICDEQTNGYSSLVRDAKDLAAGAVLVGALMAALVGLITFIPRLPAFFSAFVDKPWLALAWAVSLLASLCFIFHGRKI